MHFKDPDITEARKLEPYFSMRANRTCDSGMLDTYLWAGYYNTKICLWEDRAVLVLMSNKAEYFAAMPYCAEDDLKDAFCAFQDYFNKVLHKPFKIYLADEEAIKALGLLENPRYFVREEADFRDYLYDGEKMRTLSGGKYHKKKNQVSQFNRTYPDRWEYRTLTPADMDTITDFLNTWYNTKEEDTEEEAFTLQSERNGVALILKHCAEIPFKCGGIFVDGKLEALSIGSYNPREKMACIAVEKANTEMPGIYQAINQQFLIHEFPDAVIVNREDDMGLPGLRHAKESYHPIDYARKYMVLQKDFAGAEKEMVDVYEAEIPHSDESANGQTTSQQTRSGNRP